MTGDWVVTLDDGAHAVHAYLNTGFVGGKLTTAWDGQIVDSATVYLFVGNLRSFQHGGHAFVVGIRGFGLMGKMTLTMDGVEVPPSGTAAPEKAAAPAAPAQKSLQFVQEIDVQESDEIVGTEEYPLDNRFGDQALSTARTVSRESTNELSVDSSGKLGGTLGLELYSAIKADIEAQLSQQIGHKVGEKITESQTLTFSVGPKASVVYEVLWKRKIRSGERLYMLDGDPVTVPYRVNYGLSCEVRTSAEKR